MRFLYRFLLLGLSAVILKISAPSLELDLTWKQSLVITVLVQVFAFITASDRAMQVAVLPVQFKEDDEE